MNDKLLWVALPLGLAAAVAGVQVLRGRRPSRLGLNIASSLLLLAYLLTTAGLGIFWVANQQLPVFDWHYLFGYGTVLLVTLHLAFNLPVVVRFLARGRKVAMTAARTPLPTAAPARRGVLGMLGVLATAAAAFALGLRHGRSELRIDGRPDGTGPHPADGGNAAPAVLPDATALALVERFHAFSSHSRAGVLLRAPGVDWGGAPPAFKRYPGAARVALPRRAATTRGGAAFDLAALGTVLWHTAGVTERRGGLALRASPSSGGLFSTELYVAAHRVAGLAPGWWHHDSQTHALERLADPSPGDDAAGVLGDDTATAFGAVADDPALRDAAAVIVATAVFRRTGHKYRDRTYRYVLADLGHALENLRAAADAVGMQARLVPAFDGMRAAALLGVDDAEEGVMALVALRPSSRGGAAAAAPSAASLPPASPWVASPPTTSSPAPSASAASSSAASSPAPTPPAGATAPPRWSARLPSPGAAPLGVTAAVHAATSLRADVPSAPASTATLAASPAVLPDGAVALPAVAATTGDVLTTIATRRSVRRFAPVPIGLDALAGVLDAVAGHGMPPALSPAVRVNVVVHAVEGVAPGAWRLDPAARALLPRRVPAALRDAARAAALDQDAIGTAAAVVVLSIDRAAFAADPLGPARGYRHAFLEAGLAGERLYLAAGPRGLGACAVGAFYDDEAAALVAIDPAREWVVHFAALGQPAG